jgi:hypothetical protein
MLKGPTIMLHVSRIHAHCNCMPLLPTGCRHCRLSFCPAVCAALQLDTCVVRTWRSSCLLLRACWDAIPELRPLYAEFIDRLEDGIKRLSRCG